jgi:predicted  nucleic acid-binding Zn-ribbon protein
MEKSFWQRPEGVTGALFMLGLIVGGGILLNSTLPTLVTLAENTFYLSGMLAALAGIVFVVLDPKARNLVWYAYTSLMRAITGMFVRIDPISILKSYVEELEDNLRNLSKQIGSLRGQMRQLKGTMDGNLAEIQKNMALAEQAKKKNDDKNLTLSARKAARLQEANAKYDVLYQKMEVLYRILTKMYENSEIVLEDTKDQVMLKQQEYQAIKASHSAIHSAMSILKGDPDQRAMFDSALEALADDIGKKVGEMERFMDTSRNLMASIDLQNGVFEDEGLRMLEEFEKQNPLLANTPISTSVKPAKSPKSEEKPLDINTPPKEILRDENDYTKLFE